MPDRVRKIGPEVSREVVEHLLLRRLQLGWSRARACREMTGQGYGMTERTLQNIETGVTTPGIAGKQVRLLTVDELSAFAQVYRLTEEELLSGRWSDESGEAREEAPSPAVDNPDLHPDPAGDPADGGPDMDPSGSSATP